MVANPYDPEPEDAKRWMYSTESWPEQDWDLFLANGKCDQVLLDCARDSDCPNVEFALHCLYFLVGDVVCSEHPKKRREEVLRLLGSIEQGESKALIKWKNESLELLHGEREFDYDYWCQHSI